MRKIFVLSALCFHCIYGNQPLDDYFSYLNQLAQPQGNHQEGEIEIVRDVAEITRIQKVQENRLLQKRFSPEQALEFSRVGIVREDHYLIWLRDAVLFPKEVPGTYDRVIWKSELKSQVPGVAVLPVLASGQLVLNLNYRHATRSWELELPRGMICDGETFEAAARREVQEETGLVPSSLVFLGKMAPDTGVLSSVIPVFMGKISSRGEASPEYSEAIADVISFTKKELKQGLLNGFLEVCVKGKKKQVPLRDSFLTFALLQAEYRGLL